MANRMSRQHLRQMSLFSSGCRKVLGSQRSGTQIIEAVWRSKTR